MRHISVLGEQESLCEKKGNIARQILAQEQSGGELTAALEEAKCQVTQLAQQVNELVAQKASLQEEIGQAERHAFKNFCKKAKIKSIAEFEAQLFAKPGSNNAQAADAQGSGDVSLEELN